jgi:hypothetical protein
MQFLAYVIWVVKVAQHIICSNFVPPSRLNWQLVTTTSEFTKYIYTCICYLVIIKTNIFQRLIRFQKFHSKDMLISVHYFCLNGSFNLWSALDIVIWKHSFPLIECKQQLLWNNTHRYKILHTLYLVCSCITLRKPCNNQRPTCDIA